MNDDDVERVRGILAASLRDGRSHLNVDEELFPYVDGTLGAVERELVDTHLDDCQSCRAEVTDLAALRLRPRSRPLLRLGLAAGFLLPLLAAAVWWRSIDRPSVRAPEGVIRAAPPRAEPETPAAAAPYDNPAWVALVATALDRGRLPMSPNIASLQPSRGTLRGDTPATSFALHPMATAVDSARPRFIWPRFAGASYVVTVAGDDRALVSSPLLTTAEWVCDRALPRGRSYAWQVEVMHAGGRSELLPSPPAPAARFHILSQREHEELVDATRRYPNDHLLLAVLYSHLGMRAEAVGEIERLAAKGPASGAVRRLIEDARERTDSQRSVPRTTNGAQ